MNLFEMCIIATPVLGAMGGGTALKNSGALTTTSGVVVGVCVGIGVVALTHFLFRVLVKRDRPRMLERSRWIAPLLVVFVIPMLLPILALALSHLVVSAGLHL
jgi:hypothetical protein